MSDSNDPNRTVGIATSCQIITFDAGLFSMALMPGSRDDGSGLPAARVTVPPGQSDEARHGVSISAFRTDGWLGVSDPPTLIRVIAPRSPVLLTLYWPAAEGQAGMPRLQLTRLNQEQAANPTQNPAPAAAPMGGPQTRPSARDVEIVAHLEGVGDVGGRLGDWIGTRGSGRAIEGFALAPRLGLTSDDLEYRALIARDRLSPWLPGGQFCGSRGLGLPLLGFCIRLRGPAAARYDLACFARFVDGTEVGPIAADQVCGAASLAPLEAFQILSRPRVF